MAESIAIVERSRIAKREKVGEPKRLTRPARGVEWLNAEGCIGDRLIIHSGKRTMVFLNVEKPERSGYFDDQIIVRLGCRFFDGDIRGEATKLSFKFDKDSLLASVKEVDDNDDVMPVLKEDREMARKNVLEFIDKALSNKITVRMSPELRKTKLEKLFDKKFLDKKFEKCLKTFVSYELLWHVACQMEAGKA